MTRQVQAAVLAAGLALVFVALEIIFKLSTGIAGVFVMGMAGGLLLGNEMAKPVEP
ncbi:MAG TPA: hypothetical protein VLC48_06820 [Gemmatimonadota bacterium]|nr:hypothetical protein [Gemmatimonadota bacterium]